MARISTFPIDNTIEDKDAWIGTQFENKVTRQFTALGLYNYLNVKNVGTVFTGATDVADGSIGLVVKPLAGQQDMYLKGDATWVTINDADTTYTLTGNVNGAAVPNISLIGSDGTTNLVSLIGGPNKITTTLVDATQVRIDHDLTTRVDTVSAVSPTSGNSFTVVSSVTQDSTGHPTAVNIKTVNLPIDPNTTYSISPIGADAATVTGINLTDSDGVTDAIGFNAGANMAISRVDAANISFVATNTQEETQWTIRDSANAGSIVNQNKFLKLVTASSTASAAGVSSTELTGTGTTGDPFLMKLKSPWQLNTKDNVGYVAAGGTNNTKFWATNADGVPGWNEAPSIDQTIQGVGTDGADDIGIQLSDGGGTVILQGAGTTTTTRVDNTITFTTTDTVYNKWILGADGTGSVDQDIPSGAKLNILGGTAITATATNTRNLTIKHSDVTRSNPTNPTATAVSGETLSLVTLVTSNSQGHTTATTTTDVTWPAEVNTTYILNKAASSGNLILSADGATQNTISFSGTANEISLDVATANAYTIGLPDDVTVAGELTVSGTGQSSFGGQVTVPTTPSADTDAASKSYVLSQVSGLGSFQGGYDATNNPGSPALTGASNIAVGNGDFYTVTVGGDITFSDTPTGDATLEVGDFIFANSNITANSTPASTDYTLVLADQNIAGAGATDAGTAKGIAGFDSATFTASATGWIQSKIYSGGANKGVVPVGGGATTFLRGDGSWVAPTAYDLEGIGNSNATVGIRLNPSTGTDDDILFTGAGGIITSRSGSTITLTGTIYPAEENFIPATPAVGGDPAAIGTAGLVAAPAIGTEGTTHFLNGNNLFSIPADTQLGVATATDLGGIELGSNTTLTATYETADIGTTNRTYPVQLNSGQQAAVSVPWVNSSIITSVSASAVAGLEGLAISPTTGIVIAGFDISGRAAITAAPAATDEVIIYDGTNNKKIAISNLAKYAGSAVANQVTFWTNANAIGGDTGFTKASGATGAIEMGGNLTVDGDLTVDGNIIHGGGSSTVRGGTFIGNLDFAADTADTLFDLTRTTTGALIFDVFISMTADTDEGSIVKKFTVAHTYNADPIYNMILGSPGASGDNFTVAFTTVTNTTCRCTVTPSGGNTSTISYTVVVGNDSRVLTFTPGA